MRTPRYVEVRARSTHLSSSGTVLEKDSERIQLQIQGETELTQRCSVFGCSNFELKWFNLNVVCGFALSKWCDQYCSSSVTPLKDTETLLQSCVSKCIQPYSPLRLPAINGFAEETPDNPPLLLLPLKKFHCSSLANPHKKLSSCSSRESICLQHHHLAREDKQLQ